MKTSKLKLTVLLLLLISCQGISQKDNESKIDDSNSKSIEFQTFKDGFDIKIEKFNSTEGRDYKCNFDIKDNPSFLYLKRDFIYFEFPLARKDFDFYRAYDISSEKTNALFFVITRMNGIPLRQKPKKYLMKVSAHISSVEEIDLDRLKIDEKLRIIVFYDKLSDFERDQEKYLEQAKKYIEDTGYSHENLDECEDILKFKNVEPKENGGGVIQD